MCGRYARDVESIRIGRFVAGHPQTMAGELKLPLANDVTDLLSSSHFVELLVGDVVSRLYDSQHGNISWRRHSTCSSVDYAVQLADDEFSIVFEHFGFLSWQSLVQLLFLC